MVRRRRLWTMALATLVAPAWSAPSVAQSVAPGVRPAPEWPVGFTVIAATDPARPLAGAPRPVQIALWYPAAEPAASSPPVMPGVSYREYLALADSELPRAIVTRRGAADALSTLLHESGVPDAVITTWLDAPMLATRDAGPARGRFPLVLLAQGNGESAHDQAALAERLARRGLVVATSPSPMRVSGPLSSEADVGARAAEQADDMTFVVAALSSRAEVDATRIGVVAHSFGARGALRFAARDSRVRLLVSHDGGIGTVTGGAGLDCAALARLAALRTPVVHFYERMDAFMAPDFTFLRTLRRAPRWLVEVPAMHHHHFTTLGAVDVPYAAISTATGGSAATPRAFEAVAVATADALDAYVRGDAVARRRVESGAAWPSPLRAELLAPVTGAPATAACR